MASMTPEDRRRAAEGRDRKALLQVATGMAIIFGGMALLIAAEVAGLERRLTTATVVGFSDHWNAKGGHECTIELWTGFGTVNIYTRNLCQDAPWRIGDSAEVEARRLRLTRAVVIETGGTIFKEAYSALPSS